MEQQSMPFYVLTILLLTCNYCISRCQGSPSSSSKMNTIGFCPCDKKNASLIVHLEVPPMADRLKRAEDISKELAIDRSRVSARHRLKTSASDQRLSSKSMGVVGAVVIVVVVGLVITADLLTVKEKRQGMKRNKSGKRKSSNASLSVSVGTATTTESLAVFRRVSSDSTLTTRSDQIGINDLCFHTNNNNNNNTRGSSTDNNIFLSHLPTVSSAVSSLFDVNQQCTVQNLAKSSTNSNSVTVCYQAVRETPTKNRNKPIRSLSFTYRQKIFGTEFGLSDCHTMQPKRERELSIIAKASDVIPDIIVTCGENR